MPPEGRDAASPALPAGAVTGTNRAGFWAATAAFTAWGLIPVYWKALKAIPPFEILGHRVLWSAAFLTLVVWLQRGWPGVGETVRAPRALGLSLVSAAIIGSNWLLYIWAVNSGHVLETSLGYYINPLLNVVLGRAFFGERLRRLQVVGLVFAGAGVATLTLLFGRFPWIALSLATTFALYGTLRKVARVDALAGQWIETAFLGLGAAVYVFWLERSRAGSLAGATTSVKLLLSASGVITSLPLVGFAYGVRKLRLSTVGILQYIAPTLNFALGIWLFREPFTGGDLLAFGLIWLGVGAYAAESLWASRRPGAVRL